MPNKYFHAVVVGFIISSIFSLLLNFKFFESWQLRLSDSLFTPREANSNIVIIAIDDKSIQSIGRWPWDRSIYAKIIYLVGPQAKVIGLDVSFPEQSKEKLQDQKLAESLKLSQNVVLPVTANSLKVQQNNILLTDFLFPIPEFASVSAQGLVNMFTDVDNTTRQAPFNTITDNGEVVENFSAAIIKKYFDKNSLSEVPTDHGLLRINFIGKPGSFPIYSYSDVLENKIPLDLFKNKIVLIGSTALDLHDTLTTPVSGGMPMSGVEVHANVIQTILDANFLHNETNVASIITIFLIGIFATIFFGYFGLVIGSVGLFGMLFLYIVYTIFSFDNGIIRNIVFPCITLIIAYIVQLAYKYFGENKQKRFIKKALSYYISDSVMQDVLSSPKKLSLGGVRKEITVLFSDIAGFTTISEKLPPETLAQLLNQYLTRMTGIVFQFNGVLDKYIGDAVMAFWGAPLDEKKHALLACKAALQMQDEIGIIKKDWEKHGINDFDVRIGINSGEMVVGNMGSDVRFDYTLLGDNVNLGSRLEGINKEYGTHLIISGATQNMVKDEVIVRQLDVVAVKGKKKGVAIFELRGLGNAIGREKDFLDNFENARLMYHKGEFQKALEAFKILAKEFPHDNPTQIYIKRLEEFIILNPHDWDGTFHAKSK